MPKFIKPKMGNLMITHIGDVNVYAILPILPNCPTNSEKRRTYPQKFICNLPKGTLGILIDKRTSNDHTQMDVYQILFPEIGLGWVYSAWLKVVI
jgi:hypothetical protein